MHVECNTIIFGFVLDYTLLPQHLWFQWQPTYTPNTLFKPHVQSTRIGQTVYHSHSLSINGEATAFLLLSSSPDNAVQIALFHWCYQFMSYSGVE